MVEVSLVAQVVQAVVQPQRCWGRLDEGVEHRLLSLVDFPAGDPVPQPFECLLLPARGITGNVGHCVHQGLAEMIA